MEPPRGIWASLWNLICFLPYFIGLLILGFIKGIVLCPLVCLIITVGNSAIFLGLWPVHIIWTNYCNLRAKQFGPVLKLVLCICVTALLIVWPIIGILGSVIGGAAFGFFAPILATFEAVGEGKTDEFYHSICDGTWDTLKRSCSIVTDARDVCYYSYFSVMDDIRSQRAAEGKYYEIRLFHLLGGIIVAALGIVVDFPMISLLAIFKSFYMLFKGWHRLFHDCIGREGPFLETICVPFAGLAILLWPLAVFGAVLGSMVSSIFLGAYAGVVVYKESSLWFGLCYIVAALSIYDEYSNDVLDMPEGSCFPRPQYRKKAELLDASAHTRASSIEKPDSFKRAISRTVSITAPMIELKPLEVLDSLFKGCQRQGEVMVSAGLITHKDVADAKSTKDAGKVISIGLPAYCLLKMLIRSAKADSAGLLLDDKDTEITTTNRPKDTFFDWFLNPLLIIKEQLKAENLSEEEEDYLGKLVLLSGDPERMKLSNIGSGPESEIRRAELDALARRLRGITKSISRYPTFKRRFDDSVKTISEDLARKEGQHHITRSKSAFAKIFSQKSFKNRTGSNSSYEDPQQGTERDIEIG